MLKNVMQNAWVTNSMERALRAFAEEHGVHNFAVFDGFTLATDDGGSVVIDMALAYVGDVQLEVIRPVTGEVDLYLRHLPADDNDYALRFHHMGILLDSPEEVDAVRSRYQDSGTEIAVRGSVGSGTKFFYADTTASLGVYLEYMNLDDATQEFLATVPRN